MYDDGQATGGSPPLQQILARLGAKAGRKNSRRDVLRKALGLGPERPPMLDVVQDDDAMARMLATFQTNFGEPHGPIPGAAQLRALQMAQMKAAQAAALQSPARMPIGEQEGLEGSIPLSEQVSGARPMPRPRGNNLRAALRRGAGGARRGLRYMGS